MLTAKTGSISEAAAGCYLSQPAASMALQQLERDLDNALFDRVGKRLQLNSKGEELFPKAVAIIDRAEELELSATNTLSRLSGALKIGCSQTVGNYLLPPYIAHFKKQYPEVQFTSVVNNTHQILNKLNTFELDMALIEGPQPNDSHFVSQKWLDDEMVVIACGNHPLTKKTTCDYRDLGLYPWVLRESGSGTAALIKQRTMEKFTPKVEIVLTAFEAIKNYVENSHCLSCISKSAMRGVSQRRIRILDKSPFNFTRPIWLVVHNLKYQSDVCGQFKSHLLE